MGLSCERNGARRIANEEFHCLTQAVDGCRQAVMLMLRCRRIAERVSGACSVVKFDDEDAQEVDSAE